MEPSALLAFLHVYSLRWLFIALPIFGVLKSFCKATDVVAKIPQIRLLGLSVLQSWTLKARHIFRDRQPYSVAQWWTLKAHHFLRWPSLFSLIFV